MLEISLGTIRTAVQFKMLYVVSVVLSLEAHCVNPNFMCVASCHRFYSIGLNILLEHFWFTVINHQCACYSIWCVCVCVCLLLNISLFT